MKRLAHKMTSVTRRPFWLVVGALSLAAALFFLWRLGGDLTAFLYRPGAEVSDLTVTFWPNIQYIKHSWREHGQIPLWRTLIFCGFPFDADPQSGLWYPLNLVFAVLPTAVGFNVLFAAHMALAGLGTWTWSRSTGTSLGGALLAGLAYAFTPRTLAHLGFGHVGLVYAAAWVPWVLWAASRTALGSRRHAGALALSLGLQLLTHPQLAFYTGLVAGVYGLALTLVRCPPEADGGAVRSRAPRPPSPSRGLERLWTPTTRRGYCLVRSGWLLAGALMALLLAAVLLLPLLELAPSTTRSTMGFEETAVSSVPPRYLWGLLLADHRGWMDYVLYVGVPVLGLALIALRRRRARGWGTFALLALVVSLGTHTPLYPLAFRLLPILRWLRAPSRIWFVVAAALALMAGWGTDEVLSGWRARSRRWMNRIALAAAALGPGLVLGYAVGFERPPNNLIAFGLVVPLTAGLFAAAADERLPRRLLVGGLIGVLLADLWIVGGTMIEGRPAHAVFEDTALAQYLSTQQEDEPSRIYSPSYSLPRHVAARYGLETADGVDPLHLERYAAWMEAASGVKRKGYTETVPPLENGGDIHEVNRDARPDPHMLGLLNVRYVAAEFPVQVEGLRQIRRFGGTFLYENKQVLPRAFVVGRVEAMPDFDSALAWVQSHDVSRAAAVEGGKALDSGEVTAEIEWIRRSPSRLLLDVTVDRSAFLVLSEAWYPGWRGDVDGRSVELWRADGVLSGIYLGPGHHRVDLEYRPGRTLIGAALSLATAILVGAVIWTRRSDSEGYRDGQT